MISDIKAVADLLLQLFTERKKNREQLVDKIVTPAYEKTKGIVDVYRELLIQAVEAANAEQKEDFEDRVDSLKKLRNAYISERLSISAIAETADKRWHDKELKSFAEELCLVFFLEPRESEFTLVRPGLISSLGQTAINYLDWYYMGSISQEELVDGLQNMVPVLDTHWESLSKAYAAVKIPKI